MKKILIFVLTSLIYTALPAQDAWVQLSPGGEFTVGLDMKGSIYTWGYNGSGQLGNGRSGNEGVPIPTKISHDIFFTKVAAGNFHALALGRDSTIWGWGYNGYKQVNPHSDQTISPYPIQIDTMRKWVDIYAGFNISFAIDTLGDLYVWGSNVKGEAGINSQENMIDEITKVPVQENIRQLDCGKHFVVALDYRGSIWGWGDNSMSALTEKNLELERAPVLIDSNNIYIKVATSYNSAHALSVDGDLFSWGSNEYLESGVKDAPQIIDTFMRVGESAAQKYFFNDVVCGGTQCFASEGPFNYIYTWGTNNIWKFQNNDYQSDTAIIAMQAPDSYLLPMASKGLDDGLNIFGGHVLFFESGSDQTTYCGVGPNHVGQIGSGKTKIKFEQITCGFGEITAIDRPLTPLVNLHIYPNPAKDEIFIDSGNHRIKVLKIFNMQGYVVLKESGNSSSLSLRIDDLSSGMYIVHTQLSNGQQARSKLIIQ